MGFINKVIGDWLKSFESKRTQVSALALASIGWQIYQLVKSNQPVPAELILSFFGVLGLWVKSDGDRPTAPKPAQNLDEVAK